MRQAYFVLLLITGAETLQFTQPEYRVQIPENVNTRNDVVQVEASDNRTGPGDEILFHFMTPSGSDHFSVNKSSGYVSLIKSLDREVTPEINLTIAAVCCDDNATATSQIIVKVQDVNDNKPRFEGGAQQTTFSLSQDFQAGETLTLPTATDADSADQTIIQYTALFVPANGVNWADYMQVNQSTAELRTTKACGTTCKALFTEGKDFTFQFQLQASNPGNLGNSKSVEIVLKYPDSNLHMPVFKQGTYISSLSAEDAYVGLSLLTVMAEDKDIGQNGKIRYKLAEETLDRTTSIFHVDSNSGEITLKERFDEETDWYNFTVVATDSAIRPKSGKAEVVVIVARTTAAPDYTLVGAVAGCSCVVLIILIIVVIILVTRVRKMKTLVQKEREDKQNLKRLLAMSDVRMHTGSGRPGRRRDSGEITEITEVDGYNTVGDSASCDGGYNQDSERHAPRYRYSNNPGYAGMDTGRPDSDYMEPVGDSLPPLPRNDAARDDYMTALSTTASSRRVVKPDEILLDERLSG